MAQFPEMVVATVMLSLWDTHGRDYVDEHPELVVAECEKHQAAQKTPTPVTETRKTQPSTPPQWVERKRGKQVAGGAARSVENPELSMPSDCVTLAVEVPVAEIVDTDAQVVNAEAPGGSCEETPKPKRQRKAKPATDATAIKVPTPHQAMMNALALAIHGTIEGVTTWGRITQASKALRTAGYTAEDVPLIKAWLQAPKPVGKAWPQEYITAQSLMREAATWHGMGRPTGDQLKPSNLVLGNAPRGKAHNTHDATAKVVESAQSTADYLRSLAHD